MSDIFDKLTKARIQLLLDKCFWGNLALHLKLQKAKEVPTFATDGKHIFYNEDFVKKCSDRDIQFILSHEITHNLLFHLTRRNHRNQERWNLAIDYATNLVLQKDFGFVPDGACFDTKFNNMSAEEIYNKLPDMNKKGKKGEDGSNSWEDGDTTIEIDKKGNISVNGKKIKRFDEHKDIEGNKSEIDDMEKEWKIQAVKSYEQAKMQGKLPLGMNIFIEGLLQPKLNWRNMLRQFVVSTAKSDMRWTPPNKRFVHKGLYLPSVKGDSLGDIVVVIDNSGSVVYNQQRFFTECNSILQQYEVDLHLIVCDMKINSYKVYNKGDEIDLKNRGGGGTDLRVAFDYVREKSINPNIIVCLTDGETPFPEKEIYPTLWVLTPDGINLDNVPFGMKVKMEKEQEVENDR